jgi:hypothetical protein
MIWPGFQFLFPIQRRVGAPIGPSRRQLSLTGRWMEQVPAETRFPRLPTIGPIGQQVRHELDGI